MTSLSVRRALCRTPALARSFSYRCTLPVRNDVATMSRDGSQATIPFYSLETLIDLGAKHRQDHMYERFKSILIVKVDDPLLKYEYGNLQKEIFIKLAGQRFEGNHRWIRFVSRHLPSRVANENRVLDLAEACWGEAHRLAMKFTLEDKPELLLSGLR